MGPHDGRRDEKSGGEQGLLGLAFHPNFAANGRLFLDYTRAGDGATVISELTLRGVPITRVAALSLPDDLLIAYSPTLEDAIVPGVDAIAATIRSTAEG